MDYNFREIETKWQKKWDQKKIFEVKESKKKKFYVLDMFPYPSGEGLHMGHAFVFSLGDIFARFKRLQGFNVLYPMGYDALGLPAENAAIKAKIHPADYTKKSTTNFMKQQKAMGWSYDWSRMVNTSDPDYYKWDQWIFLKMLEKGIAYRKKAPVNWCPKCETVLANEQVVNGKCWRHEDTNVEIKHLEQWFFKITDYVEELLDGLNKLDWPENAKKLQRNWIGKSQGTEILFDVVSGKNFQDSSSKRERNHEKWPIFTTRPDTIYGVTFMVISAQHLRLYDLVIKEQKKHVDNFLKKLKSVSEKELKDIEKEGVFTGSYAINPLTKEKVPIYAGNFVLADYGSGMVMAVPGHDQRDYEFAKKYNLSIREVIKSNIAGYMVIEKSIPKEAVNKLKEYGEIIIEKEDKNWGKFIRVKVPVEREAKFIQFLEKNLLSTSDDGGAWYADSFGTTNIVIFPKKHFVIENERDYQKYLKYGLSIEIPKEQLEFELKPYTGEGVLINSGKFNGINRAKAKEEITKYLESKKLGKKVVQYKLKDWLISRQRYWGTPIPVVYCEKCGIVPLPEKDLPIILPKNVKFGRGNPLLTNEKWLNTKCPKCNGKAKRETDTMDTFVNSSWYYLRYTDPKNSKKIFDIKKANYWAPIDQYIGGPEHITMHLIYIRFYTKFLRDLGLLKFDEPALRYFTQGIVHGPDGEKMSKSRGNIVEPWGMINKYGADTLRLALVSFASPETDSTWNEKTVLGSHKFVKRVFDYFSNFKKAEASQRIESKVNKTIQEVAYYVENLKHNLAVIKIRQLFDSFTDDNVDEENAEKFLKLLHIYCPYITEEIWEKMGCKGFIGLSEWPKADEKKINEKFEKQDQAMDKIISDISNIAKIIQMRGERKENVYVYVLPNELELYNEEETSKRTGKLVKIFAVNDKDKYDPTNKSKNTKPGKPAIFFE